MDKEEAKLVLAEVMATYRSKTHAELAALLGHQGCQEIQGASGKKYQIEVDIMWDGTDSKNIRVIGGVDDGNLLSLTTYIPMTENFIMDPDGKFIGEER